MWVDQFGGHLYKLANMFHVQTKGRIYPRALQQLFVGLYVAEFCLIGLFSIATGTSVGALGPLILMVIFLVFTALYQVALNNALHPLLTYLPKSMDAEERRLLAEEHALANGEGLEDGTYTHGSEKPLPSVPQDGFTGSRSNTLSTPTTYKKPNIITKFLRPDKYTDYATMRRLVPKDVEIVYAEGQEDTAYFHPCITNLTPLLWVPRDPMGISREECHATSQVIGMTDDGAYLDEKNKIVWDAQDGKPPIFEEKVYY